MKDRVASLVAFVLLVLCCALMVITKSFFADGPVTIAIQVAAILLMIWARVTFGLRSFHAAADPTAGGVVTSGPYRFIRHPIYASIFYFVAAGTAAHPSRVSLPLALAVAILLWVRLRAEERLLLETYPEDYARYTKTTARILPRVF